MDAWNTFLPLLLRGAVISIEVTLGATAIALVLGLVIALMRISPIRLFNILGSMYVQIIRGTPLLLQLFYIYYVLPFIGVELSPFVAGILGLALNYAAYMSEVYRAGILSVDKGQLEAAASLGMTPSLTMRRIVLPQAVRLIVPPLGNYFVGMFKDSAVVSVLTLNELLFTAQLLAKSSFQSFAIFTLAAAIYFAISFPAARCVDWVESRVKMDYSERQNRRRSLPGNLGLSGRGS